MPAGLFGKLPAKRDFIASGTSRRFLEVWEPWLQSSMATSRQLLGSAWSEAYNRAPIWRFWLGASFCGEATIGAIMASVDGVGRSFPLTIFAGEGDASLPPPEIDSNEAWFASAEGLLLDALHPEASFEAFANSVSAIPPPALHPRSVRAPGLEELPDGEILVRDVSAGPSLAFGEARRAGYRRIYATQSFWWTIGGEDYPPLGLAVVGLPTPTRFASMLTGAFVSAPPQ